jgi:hypothetical protein
MEYRIIRRFCAVLAAVGLLCDQASAQQATPADRHHQDLQVENRKTLSALTDSVKDQLPPASTIPVNRQNFIDDYIFGKMKRDKIPHAGLSTDTEFLRRVHLDLTGRLPEVETIRTFVADKDPEKRKKLIESLMATSVKGLRRRLSTPFLDRWTYWFGDLFRSNDGHLSKGREVFNDYIYNSLLENLPYDQFVREMLTATARSNWTNGPANMLARDYVNETDDSIINDEDTYDQWVISSFKNFLGINVECISCHDGSGHLEKLNGWLSRQKRSDVWSQAAFFAGSRLWRPYGDYSNFALTEDGKGYDLKSKSVTRPARYAAKISPAFLLTGEEPRPGENLRQAFARMLTADLQFARATVNLIWTELMGVGIVDPPFSFDLDALKTQASHPELLDALAKDFQAHRFDLRYLIALIANSSAYQLSSSFPGEWKADYAPYFARHFVRRLPAAQIWDAITTSTGLPIEIPILRSNRKVKFVLQTMDPDDLNGDVKPLADLLDSFGHYNRYAVGDDSTGTKASVLQASILMNNPLIRERVKAQKGSRLLALLEAEPPRTNAGIVDEMFLATLSRFPTAKEKEIGVKLLQEYRTTGAEDLLWALINRFEFIANM